MADFMTVLAASQKHTMSGGLGKGMQALMPGVLFDGVLSAQIHAATEAEALLLPLVVPEAFKADATPASKKVLPVATDGDQPAASFLVPLAVVNQNGQLDIGLASTLGDGVELARATREVRATPAAFGAGRGQDLPQVSSVRPDVRGAEGRAVGLAAASVSSELSDVSEALLPPAPLTGGAESPKVLDQSAVVRQFGQFEHLARVPEARAQIAVEASLRSPGFVSEFSEKIVWLAGRQSQTADLSLNPPQMGSLEVRLSLSGNDAGAQFYSPNPAVRDAIEAALPKLREMLAQAGIALGNTQVSDQSFARQEADGTRRASESAGTQAVTAESATSLGGVIRGGLGLVDLYV